MGSLKIFFCHKGNVLWCNPAIYYLDLFFWSWLNCDINQELRKHLLFWYFHLTNSVKAFCSFCTRHCKRVLVPVMAEVFFFLLLFGQIIRCEVEQTSEDFIGPGIKLADSLTHLTTGKAMKHLRHWFRSTPCRQDFFSEKYKIWCFVPLDVCLFL